MGYAGKFAATAEAVPLGKVDCRAAARRKGCLPQLPFSVTTPPVKMRLERSAERDKREIINNSSAIDVQSAVEHI